MSTRLSDLQAGFARALIEPDWTVPSGVTSHTAPMPRRRFEVYRTNMAAGLVGVLEQRFPVVLRLVGEAFFRAMARGFVTAHPPRVPMLLAYGAAFPDYIAGFEAAADTPYLPDVARLEWLQNEAYHAADAVPLTPDAFAAIAQARLAEARLVLHPSMRLMRSPYPVFSIWRTNTYDETVQRIRLDVGGEEVLIVRPELEVTLRRLKPGGYAFIAALGEARPLGEAYERALTATPAFELTATLAGLINSGAVVGYRLD